MASTQTLYGLKWPLTINPLARELDMIRNGGRWKDRHGRMVGNGLLFHWKEAIKHLWPDVKFHKWNTLIIEQYLANRTIVIIGPASSGKTHSAAVCALLDYYAHPVTTTVIVCSTTKERLEDRIWGEIKKLHKIATKRFGWLPGHLIESRQRLVSDDNDEASEGRDFRNGLVGVPCKKGGDYVGLGDFAGLKNKRVRLFGDELSLLPRIFVDAISNLDKNTDFKAVGMGNPKETTDALGVLAEPAADLGGWDGAIDQTPFTKTWRIRRPNGVCIQLPGTDSPNLDGNLGIPLITQEQIDRDVAFYGKDSLWFTMMDQGMMPRGQGSRRVITRQFCLKHHAMDDPVWSNTNITYIAFLDAAYRGVGGDRCVFGVLCFGPESVAPTDAGADLVQSLVNIRNTPPPERTILSLVDIMIVPIKAADMKTPEDQIVDFVRAQCEQRRIPPDNFYFDSGMRTSLVTAFARLWSVQVNSIDCGGKPSERNVSANIPVKCCDYYSKFITELWFSVRLTIEAEQFRGMTEEVMLEGCQREWKMVGANKTEVETKEEMKAKTGRSPDLFDALAIGIEGARRRGFIINRLRSADDYQRNDAWKTRLAQKARTFAAIGSLNHGA